MSAHGQSARWRRTLAVTAPLVTAIVAAGCGDGLPRRVPVAGAVMIDGEPLKKGSVVFVPENGRPSAGRIGDDGRFVLRCFDEDDGAIVGVHRVAISAKDIISEKNIKWYAPSKYTDYRTSGLTVEVTKAVDDLVIELTWAGEESSR